MFKKINVLGGVFMRVFYVHFLSPLKYWDILKLDLNQLGKIILCVTYRLRNGSQRCFTFLILDLIR